MRAARDRWLASYASSRRSVVAPAVMLGLVALAELVVGVAILATTSGQSPEGAQLARTMMGTSQIAGGVLHAAALTYSLASHAADHGTHRVLAAE